MDKKPQSLSHNQIMVEDISIHIIESGIGKLVFYFYMVGLKTG